MLEETVSDACEAVGRYVELRPRATLALTALLCAGLSALAPAYATLESDAERMFTPPSARVWSDHGFDQWFNGAPKGVPARPSALSPWPRRSSAIAG